MRFVIDANLQPLQDKLAELAQKGKDLTPLMNDIGEAELTNILLRFEQKQKPDGSAWKGLQTRVGDALSDTGQLKSSFRSYPSPMSVSIGSIIFYAPFHQFGTNRVEARPFLGVSSDLMRQVDELISEYFL